jgi:hypothetical protein
MSEATASGVTLTGEGVHFFQRGAALRGLAIEIYTGMKLSNNGSGLDACRAQHLLPEGRTTKKAGLRNAVKEMKRLYPTWEVSRSIQMALDKK